MSMGRPAAYGLYAHDVAPHEIVCVLNQAGFGNEDICIVLSPVRPIATVVRDASILNPEPEARAATAVRGNLATLVALGFPGDQAERFENELRLEAGVLVYVSCAESAKTGWAVELLRGMGARECASWQA
jgi:hypothetical protein